MSELEYALRTRLYCDLGMLPAVQVEATIEVLMKDPKAVMIVVESANMFCSTVWKENATLSSVSKHYAKKKVSVFS